LLRSARASQPVEGGEGSVTGRGKPRAGLKSSRYYLGFDQLYTVPPADTRARSSNRSMRRARVDISHG